MLAEQNLSLEHVYPGSKPKTSVILPPTNAAPKNGPLSEALLEDSSTRQRRSPRDWALSFVAHFAILSLLLLMPLYFSQGIDMKRLETTLLVAPMPPMAPAPPPPPAAIARAVHVAPRVITAGQLTAPTFIPKAVPTPTATQLPLRRRFRPRWAACPAASLAARLAALLEGCPASLRRWRQRRSRKNRRGRFALEAT